MLRLDGRSDAQVKVVVACFEIIMNLEYLVSRSEPLTENQGSYLGMLRDAYPEASFFIIWKRPWDRLIPVGKGELFLVQRGDKGYDDVPVDLFHSPPIITFPDGITMFLAEDTGSV